MNRQCVLGIVAHVDAGKTTLTEGMLYESGTIRHAGRVDHGDAFLDTDAMEKDRGITIFSKQARMQYKDLDITILDTPGHVVSAQRWNEPYRCWIIVFWSSAVQMEYRHIPKLCGSC